MSDIQDDQGLSEGFEAFYVLKDLGQFRRGIEAWKSQVFQQNLKGSAELNEAIIELQEIEEEIASASYVAFALDLMDPQAVLEDVKQYVDENSQAMRLSGDCIDDNEGANLLFTVDHISLAVQEADRASTALTLTQIQRKKLKRCREAIQRIGQVMEFNKVAFVGIALKVRRYCKDWGILDGPLHQVAHPSNETLRDYIILGEITCMSNLPPRSI